MNHLHSRLERQVSMLLNTGSNTHTEFLNIRDYFAISKETANEEVNDLDSTSKKQLLDSLEKSKDLFDLQRPLRADTLKHPLEIVPKSKEVRAYEEKLDLAISSLEKGKQNSFIVLPLLHYGHLNSAIIRRKDTGELSFMLIDKIVEKPFTEYTIEKDKSLSRFLVKNMKRANVFSKINSDSRNDLKKISKNVETYDIKTTNQIVGNCLIKELDLGIRFAIQTRTASYKDIEDEKIKQSTKLNTENYYTKYVEKLISKYENSMEPATKEFLQNELQVYKQNKDFKRRFDDEFVNIGSISKEEFRQKLETNFPKILEESFKKGSFVENLVSISGPGQVKTFGLGAKRVDDLLEFSKLDKSLRAEVRNFITDKVKFEPMKEQNKLIDNPIIDTFARKELYEKRTLDKKIDKAISPLGNSLGRVALLCGAVTLISTVIAPPLVPILAGVTATLAGLTVGVAVIHNLRELTGANNKPQPINEVLLEDRLAKVESSYNQTNLDKSKEKQKGNDLSKGIELYRTKDKINFKLANRDRHFDLRNNNEVKKIAIVKSKESQPSKGLEHL